MSSFENQFAASIRKNKSINSERIEISWGNPANLNWAIKTPSGFEIWSEQVCSHAFKNRGYAPKIVETISPAEFEARNQEIEKKSQEAKVSQVKRNALESQVFPCPCCGEETNKWEAQEYKGEYFCYSCFSGMYE